MPHSGRMRPAESGATRERSRRALSRLAAAAVTVATMALATPAWAGQGCAEGVTVVVDFAAFGGEVEARCAPGAPQSGLAALESAGFTVTTVQNMPGFVCRIDGEPAGDPCDRTPPADAYWGYWHAAAGEWGYATAGAVARAPEPGTVEGWAFTTPGADGPPAISPADAVAGASATTPATTEGAGGGPSTGVIIGLGALAGIVAAVVVSAVKRRGRR